SRFAHPLLFVINPPPPQFSTLSLHHALPIYIFIIPDQATVAAAYNANNPLIPSTDEGASPRHEGDTGSVETFWKCVGAERIVPDFMSLSPGSGQNAPFAGATRRLCDRKEVTLEDQ